MEPSKGHKQTRDSGHPILVVGCGVGRLQSHRRFTLTTPSTYFRASTRENFPIGLGSGRDGRPFLNMEGDLTGKGECPRREVRITGRAFQGFLPKIKSRRLSSDLSTAQTFSRTHRNASENVKRNYFCMICKICLRSS